MNKKKGGKIAAVIDIGSNMLKMSISQLKKGQIVNLDRLEYPLHLGHEVFNNGTISFESLRELSRILHGYSDIMAEYGIDQYEVVATTALREAKNKVYVTDQLKIQNDMTVQILEDDQEKSLIYSEILDSLKNMEHGKATANTLITYIGTGSIGLAVFDGKRIVFSQNISMGSLKLHDMLGNIQEDIEDFYTVVEEYLSAIINHIAIPLAHKTIDGLILTGNEVELIAKICKVEPTDGRYIIKTELIHNLFHEIRVLTPEKISIRYGVSEESAEVLYSSVVIYAQLLKLAKCDYVVSPKIELWDALMHQMLLPKSKLEYYEHVRQNAISCAQVLAKRYNCNEKHYEAIRTYACNIFGKMKSIHGLDHRKQLILELAAILHDCGYYINSKQHLLSTFSMIKHMDIYGMTDEEMLITAYIAKYNEYDTPNYDDIEFIHLNEEECLIVSKLVAIFRLANALDKSQKQKLEDIKVKLEDNKLLITGESDKNLHLEKWAFEQSASFFKEVFGITPELIIKSLMI